MSIPCFTEPVLLDVATGDRILLPWSDVRTRADPRTPGQGQTRDVVGPHTVDATVAELDRSLVTSPRSLRSTQIALSVVVLPAPLAPSNVVIAPSPTRRSTRPSGRG